MVFGDILEADEVQREDALRKIYDLIRCYEFTPDEILSLYPHSFRA